MTLGIVWERIVKKTTELVVASDSRLSGGREWDCNPKIVLLPRSDAVISFAGATHDAYPLMLQAVNAITMYSPASNRVMDISDLKGHLVRVFTDTQSFIKNLPFGQTQADPPEAVFLLSGYSWKQGKFRIWELHFDANIQKFTFRPIGAWRGQTAGSRKVVKFVGDEAVVTEAKKRLAALLTSRRKIDSGSLDMEPFEVLRDLIREANYPTVGGPPQFVKIYRHFNVVPFGVYWPDRKNGKTCVLGRPLLEYEKNPWSTIDPDTLEKC